MTSENLSNVRGVWSEVLECRIDVGPEYRVNFGKALNTLIVLLGGGTTAHHQREIEDARDLWQECIRCKQREV